jgi:uncharacterized membrane protein YfcA
VLLPAFALFFPAPAAVAATAVVHLLNNLFKASLLAAKADWGVVLRFGLPAAPAAVLGAWLLTRLGETGAVFAWDAFGHRFGPTAAGLAIGAVMIVLGVLELMPWFQRLAAPPSLAPLGGALTGFIGGLSGQQGALRSMFLLRLKLEPAVFIATGVMLAVVVDLSRIPAYLAAFAGGDLDFDRRGLALIGVGTLAAVAGAWIGVRVLKKATIGAVRALVAAMMLGIGGALAAGLIGT